jgi:drug/metabolite transporter (DMT)-like permease
MNLRTILSSRHREGRALELTMALFCILVWGLSFAVTRSAVRQIPPLTLATLRFFLGAALLWALTRKISAKLRAEDRKWIAMLSFSGITFYFSFENFGLSLTTASHASLIIAIVPLATELVAARRNRRWPAITVWLGALTAIVGVGLLVGHSSVGASPAGDLLMVGAGACWVVYTFVVQRMAGRYPNMIVTRWMMLLGALTLMPGALVETLLHPLPHPGLAAWSQVLFLGIVCSAAAYDLWNRAVPALGPTAVNTLIYFIPLVGVIGGIVFLNEAVTPSLFIGGGLILGGVLLGRWKYGIQDE